MVTHEKLVARGGPSKSAVFFLRRAPSHDSPTPSFIPHRKKTATTWAATARTVESSVYLEPASTNMGGWQSQGREKPGHVTPTGRHQAFRRKRHAATARTSAPDLNSVESETTIGELRMRASTRAWTFLAS